MTIGEKIKKLRKASDLTLDELAAATNTTKQTIYKYESGIISNIPASKIKAIADKLNTTPAYLMGWEDEPQAVTSDLSRYGVMPITTKRIPLLGDIACGKPIFADEDRELYVEVGTDINADFCLRAKGDSMINARIYDGDIVFIRKQNAVDNGEIAAVVIEDAATLKRVYYDRERNILQLMAENTDYPPQIYSGAELDEINILGKAVAFQSDVR